MVRGTIALLLLVLIGTSLCDNTHEDPWDRVKKELGFPEDTQGVLMFGQASHLDWDWQNWFPTNVNNDPKSIIPYWDDRRQPTDHIFQQATEYLEDPNYGYSVCEMGFLRRFQVDNPATFDKMIKSPGNLQIVGGGITSPDNLLPHGEAFIRDFLTGIAWVKSAGIKWSGKVWIPDDFGHDSQLPVSLQAIGATGTSFSRVPGGCDQGLNHADVLKYHSAHWELVDAHTGGLDFFWVANDNSSIFSYYQPNGYCDGDGIYTSEQNPNTPQQLQACAKKLYVNTTTPYERIQSYLGVRVPLAQTPYLYVATGCDFTMPVVDLLKTLEGWNRDMYPKTGYKAIVSTFANYTDNVLEYLKANGGELHRRNYHGLTPTTHFKPAPYFCGFLVSRVALKQMHYQTTKYLLGAEVFLSTAQALNVSTTVKKTLLEDIWNQTAPSTHHDFVTGTSVDYVYLGEQIPILTNTTKHSCNTKTRLIGDIVRALNQGKTANQKIVTFNQLGYTVQQSPTIIRPLSTANAQEMEDYESLASLPNVQRAREGHFVALVSNVPSLGYSTQSPNSLESMPLAFYQDRDDSITIKNSFVTATFSKANNWAIDSIVDAVTKKSILQNGNVLHFRHDLGNLYRFGYEEGCGFDDWKPSITPLEGKVVENGAVRIVVEASVQVATSSWANTYNMTYILYANEPMVRISVNGSAPLYTTVFTSFKWADKIHKYDHGTPNHWDYKTPFPMGLQQDFQITFEAVHDFFIPRASSDDAILGAIYHNNTPAWGVSRDGFTTYGAILRNSPNDCASKGAAGHDNGTHIVTFAIRVPSGLGNAETGQPLAEARLYHTGLVTYYIGNADFTSMPERFSLATVTSPAGAFINAAKLGQYDDNLYLRVYYPSNKPSQVAVQVAPQVQAQGASLYTALEEPLTWSVSWNSNSNILSYVASTALTTVGLQKE